MKDIYGCPGLSGGNFQIAHGGKNGRLTGTGTTGGGDARSARNGKVRFRRLRQRESKCAARGRRRLHSYAHQAQEFDIGFFWKPVEAVDIGFNQKGKCFQQHHAGISRREVCPRGAALLDALGCLVHQHLKAAIVKIGCDKRHTHHAPARFMEYCNCCFSPPRRSRYSN